MLKDVQILTVMHYLANVIANVESKDSNVTGAWTTILVFQIANQIVRDCQVFDREIARSARGPTSSKCQHRL